MRNRKLLWRNLKHIHGRGGHPSPVTVLEVTGKRREALDCGDKLFDFGRSLEVLETV